MARQPASTSQTLQTTQPLLTLNPAPRLGLNKPFYADLHSANTNALIDDQASAPSSLSAVLLRRFKQTTVWLMLGSSLIVHTGQAIAQYQYGNTTPNASYNSNSANRSGYSSGGQLYQGGQPVAEHQAHIDARNVANATLYNIIAQGLSTATATNAGFVHQTLGQIETAATIAPGGTARSATVIYLGTTPSPLVCLQATSS